MQTPAKVGLAIAGIAIAAGITAGVLYLRKPGDDTASLMQQAREMGLPLTPEELHFPAVSDARNGAVAFKQAAMTVSKADESAMSKAAYAKRGTEQWQAGMSIITRIQPTLQRIDEASRLPAYYVPIQWKSLLTQVYPDLVQMKAYTRAFCIRAEDRSHNDNLKGALADIATAQRITQFPAQRGLMIDLLVQCANAQVVERVFDEIVREHRSNPAFLAAAARIHAQFGPLPDITKTLRTEMVLGLAELPQYKTLEDAGLVANGADGMTMSKPITDQVRDEVKRCFLTTNISQFRNMPHRADDWKGVIAANSQSRTDTNALSRRMSKQAQILLGAFSLLNQDAVVNILETIQEKRRMTDAALQLCQMHQRDGRFPASLTVLGDSAIDPFTNHPFEYTPTATGFTLKGRGSPSRALLSNVGDRLVFE